MSIYDTTLDWDAIPEADETGYAWDSLGEIPEYNIIADANNLDTSTDRARKGTGWKYSVQAFCWWRLRRISQLQRALTALERDEAGAYEPQDGTEFLHNERGRLRPITAQVVDDRVVSHCMNDFELIPKIRPHLIYDNGASLKHKGLDFSRKRMRVALERYYRREGTNVGYIYLEDKSKYYDNIPHEGAYATLCHFTENELARKIIRKNLRHAELDMSDLSPELFKKAKKSKVDRVKWRMGNHPKGGTQMLRKGVAVGDQLSQTIGIVYPWRADNEARTVQGSRYYQRYMDDSADIDRDLERLKRRAAAVAKVSTAAGMFINERKTTIARIDKGFVWLKHWYRLRKDGTVEERMLPKSIHDFRRHIRHCRRKVDSGQITAAEMAQTIRSWLFARRDYISYPRMRKIELLTLELYGREAYEQVYDHAEKWKAAPGPGEERQHVRQPGRGHPGRPER